MPRPRPDAEYLRRRIRELYKTNTARQIAALLSADPNVSAPVTERVVYNILYKLRREADIPYKDKPWTEPEDLALRRMYTAGMHVRDIARQLGRPLPSVHTRIRQLGLANRKITDEQRASIRNAILVSQKTLREIAWELGISYNAVRHVNDLLKREYGIQGRRRPDASYWVDGSLAERLIRSRLREVYGEAVVPPERNREWSEGRGYQIDIPLVLPDGLQVAVEVNHVGTHALRKYRDLAKRRFAEQLGWIWLPIWMEGEPTEEAISKATNTILRIVEALRHGDQRVYETFIQETEQLEKAYYFPEQPPYDPKACARFGERWNDADIEVLRAHYGRTPMEQVQALLSTPRTRHAIIHKARQLGLTKGTTNFTSEEDELIRTLYPVATRDEILAKLPGRTWYAITSRAMRLGVRRRKVWSTKEDEILRQHYPTLPDEKLLEMLPGRSLLSIRSRANELGLRKATRWSAEEDERLKRVYPAGTRAEILAALPGRSWQAIISRASRLRIRRLQPFEHEHNEADTAETAHGSDGVDGGAVSHAHSENTAHPAAPGRKPVPVD
jgi:hypothetical protein